MTHEPPPLGLALLLRHTERRIQLGLRSTLEELELSSEHWRAMSVLAATPGLGMAALAEAAVLAPASLTRHVERLVERGIIVRRIDPLDKRRVVVALSPVGTVVAARLRSEEARIERDIRDDLGPDRYASLVADLAVFTGATRAPAPSVEPH